MHNSRPWRWIVGETVVDLFADHRRVGSKDRSGRAAIISCDPALDHFRTAMGARGWRTNVDRFPGPGERDHLASLTPRPSVTTAQRDCAEAIVQRRTDSLPFRAPECWEEFEPSLRCSNPVWRPAASPSDVMQFRRSNRPRPEE